MKKGLALVLVLMLALTVSSALAEDLLDRIQARGELVIGTEADWAPWTYYNEDFELVGLDVEIGTMIAEGLGVKPVFMKADFDFILAGVEGGRFDIGCNGVGYTSTRAESFAFSTPYLFTPSVLVVHLDNEDIHSLEDLQGRKTANSPASTYAQLAVSLGADVQYVNTLSETIMLLEQGRVEATINSKSSIELYIEQHPEAKIKIVSEFPGDPVAYPMRKGEDSARLVERVNEILQAAREDGRLAAISVKYFGADLTNPE